MIATTTVNSTVKINVHHKEITLVTEVFVLILGFKSLFLVLIMRFNVVFFSLIDIKYNSVESLNIQG